MALVFYDTETTGRSFPFDQIIQFAAIKTDADLNEIDRFEARSRLLPHVVPTPGAMRVNRVTPATLTDPFLPSHYEMVRAIRSKLQSWSPSIFMGFNTIDYDEKMLRYALYKTLHSPYLTNTNKNARSDVLRLARATDVFAPGVLTVPRREWGTPAFDLESLAHANGILETQAHNAMDDAEVTLKLARLIMEGAPSLWSSFMRFAQKSAVLDHVRQETIFGLTDFFSGGKPYSWLVTLLGVARDDNNRLIVFDLQIDPDDLAQLDDDELAIRLAEQPRPLKKFKANECPIITAVEDAPSIAVARFLDAEELERRARRLKEDPALVRRLIAAYEGTPKVWDKSPYVEAQIFDGFTSNEDLAILETFHDAAWADRATILQTLTDKRLHILGEELIYLESPGALPEHRRQHHQRSHDQRVLGLDADVPWMTLPKALEEIEMALRACGDEERAGLLAHRTYLEGWRDRVSSAAA